MTHPSKEQIEYWANDPKGPVALHLRQRLLPVEGIIEGQGAVLFPPTYAGDRKGESDYNIDELWDGRSVATIDSVGSQANRMEPIFKRDDLVSLVPQTRIKFSDDLVVSLLDVGHRVADASIRNSNGADEIRKAFQAWLAGDATPMARLAPTSIVFGVWDSREGGAKIPRLVQSVIRAWDVKRLRRSAQYVPPVDYSALDVFSAEAKEKAEGSKTNPLAERGFVHVPNTGPGGIVARGPILRDVTINLVALRGIRSAKDEEKLRRYILGLALVAATNGVDGHLRQGCLLTLDPEMKAEWHAIERNGARTPLALDETSVLDRARAAAKDFGVGESKTFTFEPKRAEEDVKKKEKSAKANKKGENKDGTTVEVSARSDGS